MNKEYRPGNDYFDDKLSSCVDLKNNQDFMIEAINYDSSFYDNASDDLKCNVDFTMRVIKSHIFDKDFLKRVVHVFINSNNSPWEQMRVLALIPESLRNECYYAITKNNCYTLRMHGESIAALYSDMGYTTTAFSIIERKLCYDSAAIKMMALKMIDSYINENVRTRIIFSNSNINFSDRKETYRILIGYLYTKDEALAKYIITNPEVLQKQVLFIMYDFNNLKRIEKKEYTSLYTNVKNYIFMDEDSELTPDIVMFLILKKLKLENKFGYVFDKKFVKEHVDSIADVDQYIDAMQIHDIKLYMEIRDFVVEYIEKFRVAVNIDIEIPKKKKMTSTLAEIIPIKIKKG